MNSTVEQAIRQAVSKMVNDGFMFTAYDVTRMVRRALGKATFVSHSDVNSLVQQMFNGSELGSYIRDVITVGSTASPWLYYHPYGNVSNYDPHWLENNPDQTGMKVDVTATPTIPASGGYTPPTLGVDDDDEDEDEEDDTVTASGVTTVSSATVQRLGKNEHRLTKEGRLQIPIDMARAAGFYPTQTVSVVDNGGKLTIMSPAVSAVNTFPVLVERDGRIRLCQTTLKRISPNPKGGTFKVERSNSEIVIETV